MTGFTPGSGSLPERAVPDYSEPSTEILDNQAKGPSETQPSRFLDLPKEVRFMIYEELMDNEKSEVKFTQPKGLEIELVYIEDMHYPSLLRVNKLVSTEYWSLCLRDANLWIIYSVSEGTSHLGEDVGSDDADSDADDNQDTHEDVDGEPEADEDSGWGAHTNINVDAAAAAHTDRDPSAGEDLDPGRDTDTNEDSDTGEGSDTHEDSHTQKAKAFPLLSKWLRMPKEALDKVTGVIFKFEAKRKLPTTNPFSGIAQCSLELPSLKFFGIWSEFEMNLVESGVNQETRDLDFECLVEDIFNEECYLYRMQAKNGRRFNIKVDFNLYSPLYEMNHRFKWPRRRHLAQGIAPLAGLPKWGYSKFFVVPPWARPSDNSFMYHGEELAFSHVEYMMPVPERIEDYDRCSEYSFDFNDDSDWAMGLAGGDYWQ